MRDINIQIGTSQVGDIQLTASRVDEDGNIVLNEYGKPLKDIARTLTNTDWYKQMFYSRLMTQNPDWYHWPNIGANLEDLIGEQNNETNANIGANYIKAAISQYGLLNASDITVKAVPASQNEVVYFIKTGTLPDTIYIAYDYSTGLGEVGTV